MRGSILKEWSVQECTALSDGRRHMINTVSSQILSTAP